MLTYTLCTGCGAIPLPWFIPNERSRPTLQHLCAQLSAVSLPSGISITQIQVILIVVLVSAPVLLISSDATMNPLDAIESKHSRRPSGLRNTLVTLKTLRQVWMD